MNDLNGNFPNFIFCKIKLFLGILLYLLKQITIVGIFHYNTQIGACFNGLVDKGFIVLNNIAIALETCEYPDLIDGILPFFIAQAFNDPNLFQGVDKVILLPDDFIDT